MEDDQQFCLRWNNHQSTLISVFDTLLEKGIHVDCTLAAEGQTLRAHKVVLSACSPYFENVLSQQYDKHPIIILKDVKYAELRAMMDYMYRGEVNISQDQLAALLKAAESLQIKGLSDNKPARPPNTHPPRSTTPVTKVRDGSVDSREGSTSPTRRRKKARRASTDGLTATTNSLPIPVATAPVAVPVPIPVPVAPAPPADEAAGGEPADCKVEEGSRGTDGEGVEDLTLDEENEEPPAIAQNDVVRNFQWHMERSQEEMMNTDGARDSQGRPAGSKTDNIIKIKKVVNETASTFAVLRNVVLPNEDFIEPMPDQKPIKLPISPSSVPLPNVEKSTNKELLIKSSSFPIVQKATLAQKKDKVEKSGTARRGRPPKKDRDVKKGRETQIIKDNEKEKDVKKLKIDKKEKAVPKVETGNIEKHVPKKENEDEYDFVSGDSSGPLPCSQYKTDNGYKCPNCSRCYNARKNLVRHVSLECGRDPQYQCPHCPYSKHRRNELKKHLQKKHANEPERPIKRRL